eukprot:353231-Chlamydomonas_euryale.AAC.5
MDEWMDEMDEMDEWMDGWMNGWMDSGWAGVQGGRSTAHGEGGGRRRAERVVWADVRASASQSRT